MIIVQNMVILVSACFKHPFEGYEMKRKSVN